MKKLSLNLAIAAAALVSSAAHAADGTITFTGDITATTCIVGPGSGAAAGAPKAIQISMPELADTALDSDGATSGDVDFSLKLDGGADCIGQSGKLANMGFSGANIDPVTGRLNNAGDATNIQVELLSAGVPLHLANDKISFNVNATGDNELPMTARYRAAGGPAGQGSVDTAVEYTLSYN